MAQGNDSESTKDRPGTGKATSGAGKVEGRAAKPYGITAELADAEKVEVTTDDPHAQVAHEGESDASVVRRAAQSQRDNVAIVSRRSDGTSDQHPGHGLVTVGEGDELDEVTAAAIENRPERQG